MARLNARSPRRVVGPRSLYCGLATPGGAQGSVTRPSWLSFQRTEPGVLHSVCAMRSGVTPAWKLVTSIDSCACVHSLSAISVSFLFFALARTVGAAAPEKEPGRGGAGARRGKRNGGGGVARPRKGGAGPGEGDGRAARTTPGGKSHADVGPAVPNGPEPRRSPENHRESEAIDRTRDYA